MDKLKSFLIQLLDLNEDEWAMFCAVLKEKKVPAKTILIKQGSIAKEIYLIKTGLIRVYHLEDGKEINTYFSCDTQFISTYTSIITQNPSIEIMETLEDCDLYCIPIDALENIYKTHPKFEKIGRYLAEQNYLCISNRTMLLQTKTAKERYVDFTQNNPKKIIQNVPQHHIASFLGIAPESLSRIRRLLVTS